jgi:hypothetical protein
MLIAWNGIADDKTIVPTSMSGSYYSSARNLFVGSLCALGVFLILYRHTTLQNLCTWCAGAFALLVAFAPTAPAPPATEPQWINYLHHAAAGALILTLGVFCFVLERGDAAGAASLDPAEPARYRAQPQVPSLRKILYFTCGSLVLLSGAFALYTGVWPTSWSTGWPSLYLFEAVAVFAFGIAWIIAAAVRAITIQQRVVADLVRQRGSEDPATRTAWTRLAALYGSAGHSPGYGCTPQDHGSGPFIDPGPSHALVTEPPHASGHRSRSPKRGHRPEICHRDATIPVSGDEVLRPAGFAHLPVVALAWHMPRPGRVARRQAACSSRNRQRGHLLCPARCL